LLKAEFWAVSFSEYILRWKVGRMEGWKVEKDFSSLPTFQPSNLPENKGIRVTK
jgi:hypothetical protein